MVVVVYNAVPDRALDPGRANLAVGESAIKCCMIFI